MHRRGILIVLVLIILLACAAGSINTNAYEDYLYGLWVGDPSFCQDADIESMMIFIGRPLPGARFSRTVKRGAYIVIADDVCSQYFTLAYTKGWAGPWNRGYRIAPTLEFEEEPIMAPKVDISVDMKSGIMRIYHDGTLYGRLYKDNMISNVMD